MRGGFNPNYGNANMNAFGNNMGGFNNPMGGGGGFGGGFNRGGMGLRGGPNMRGRGGMNAGMMGAPGGMNPMGAMGGLPNMGGMPNMGMNMMGGMGGESAPVPAFLCQRAGFFKTFASTPHPIVSHSSPVALFMPREMLTQIRVLQDSTACPVNLPQVSSEPRAVVTVVEAKVAVVIGEILTAPRDPAANNR